MAKPANMEVASTEVIFPAESTKIGKIEQLHTVAPRVSNLPIKMASIKESVRDLPTRRKLGATKH